MQINKIEQIECRKYNWNQKSKSNSIERKIKTQTLILLFSVGTCSATGKEEIDEETKLILTAYANWHQNPRFEFIFIEFAVWKSCGTSSNVV